MSVATSIAAQLAAEVARLENLILLAFLRTLDHELAEEVERIVRRRRALCRALAVRDRVS